MPHVKLLRMIDFVINNTHGCRVVPEQSKTTMEKTKNR